MDYTCLLQAFYRQNPLQTGLRAQGNMKCTAKIYLKKSRKIFLTKLAGFLGNAYHATILRTYEYVFL